MVGLLPLYRKSAPEIEHLKKLAKMGSFNESTPGPVASSRARQLRKDEQDQLIELYESGQTMIQLACTFRVHRTTVAQHLRDHGVIIRDIAMTDRQIDEAVRLYESGLSFVNVGARLGFNASTVTTHIKRRGVKIRGPHERRT